MARRGCAAFVGSSFNHHTREACPVQFTTNQRGVVIAVRRACLKAWRIARKDFREGVGHIVSEHVLLNAVPHVEQETSSGFEHPLCLTVARLAVGKEHDAKLATNQIEGSILERQRQCVCLAPTDATVCDLSRGGVVKHRLVEVGYHVAGVRRKSWCQCSGDDATASGGF